MYWIEADSLQPLWTAIYHTAHISRIYLGWYMNKKCIFSCVWPCSSQIIANPKSLLNIHVHSFLWSVNFYWAPKVFQTLASALEKQNWIRQIAHSLEGYVSKSFWWSEWHVNIPLNTSVKTDFSLPKGWGNRSLGEFILKYSSPISHIPISTQRTGWHLKLFKALKQTLPHATWLSCSRWLQEKWGFQDIPSCHQFGDVFETAHF